MFDFLRKRLNRTIDDASESAEEELEEELIEESDEQLDNQEEQETQEEETSDEKSSEYKTDAYEESEDESIEEEFTEEEFEDESIEEEFTEEESEDESEDEDSENEIIEAESEEESTEEESVDDTTGKEENESRSLSFFGRFRRRSDTKTDVTEDKSDDDKESSDIGDSEEKTDLEEIKTKENESEDQESLDESQEEELEEEPEQKPKRRRRLSFFGRGSSDDTEEESEDEIEESIDEEIEEDLETIDDELEEDLELDSVEEDIEEEFVEEEFVEEESEDKDSKEDTGRFGFLRRGSSDDEEDKEDKEDSGVKYEDEEEGGRFSFITKKTIKEEDIEDTLEILQIGLLESDVAFDVADTIVESVKEDIVGRKIRRRGDMKEFTTNALKKAISEIIDNGYYDLIGDIEESRKNGEPYKIMFVGINGTGKTTTIAKVATYLEKRGYSSVFGASDTFRAGAIEQLEHHADNLNVKMVKHERNSDPAAVAYDAVEHARANDKDLVLIDTSGRMQTNANLMDEMEKIKRVSKPDIVIYVGDALMGNDATEQAYEFNEVIEIDGIILTKTDADAKGGAIISIGHVIHKPILFLGTGQSYDDLIEFEPDWLINKIFDEDDTAVEA